MIRNKSYIFSGDMQVITEILDGKTFHQCASRIDEFYRLKFGDTCITRKNIRFISYIHGCFVPKTCSCRFIKWPSRVREKRQLSPFNPKLNVIVYVCCIRMLHGWSYIHVYVISCKYLKKSLSIVCSLFGVGWGC